MSDVAIKVQNLSKRYRIGAREERHETMMGSLIDLVKQPFTNLKNVRNLTRFNSEEQQDDIIWALKDVSFEVKRGEVVGIIGRNGAGKSTLLKILSRITQPTSGSVELHGRVSSLLEVGTGFHRELTGRENIYLNGSILGMTKREIDQKFDEIVAFSGIEKFIDTPVKRYSSGMQVRLAFAVAAHLEPEILMIDEVLAVGDVEFQKKCLGKMQDVANAGRTVLFVSHNMSALKNLCKRGILLKEGRSYFDDNIESALKEYVNTMKVNDTDFSLEKCKERKGTADVIFADFWIENNQKEKIKKIFLGEEISFYFKIKVTKKILKKIDIGFSLHNYFGETVTALYSGYQNFFFNNLDIGYYIIKCELSNLNVTPGNYFIKGLIKVNETISDWPEKVLSQLNVELGNYYIGSKNISLNTTILLKGDWQFSTSND